jgi:hypothetical protein
VAAFGEYPAQNLSANWEKLFRRSALPNLGQRRYPLIYEASHPSTGTMVESPLFFFFFLLFVSAEK